jgi:diaphanous 1
MPDNPLIIPIVIPTGSIHFATIRPDGNVQDVINALILTDEVNSEVLGDLEVHGWALQKIRKEHAGRQWEEADLIALGDGVLFMQSQALQANSKLLQVYWIQTSLLLH